MFALLLVLAAQTLQGKEYTLDGGGKVEVYKPFGSEYYSAIVTMDGEYPGSGKIAHDRGRSEFIYVLDGSFEIKINEKPHQVKAGENLLVRDGDNYTITGEGRCLVMVHDRPGGKTEILSPKN